jgi:hypothetical protein
VLAKEGCTFSKTSKCMAYRLNRIERRISVLDFIVFLVIATSIALVFSVLLLSAAIQVPNALIRRKLISSRSRG